MRDEIINKIIKIIKEKNSFLLTSHVFPDGDSLGSVLGLGIFLKENLKKQVNIVQEGEVPSHYKFLPKQDWIQSKEKIKKKYDVVIVCECPDPERMGNVLNNVEKEYELINIDHHQDNKMYGTVNFLDTKAAALGELIYEIITKIEPKGISKDIAINLYTAVLTDTGCFSYSNTTGQTLRIAGNLLDSGLNPWTIAKEVYHTRSFPLTKLFGMMLSTITTTKDGRIAYAYITKKMFQETGVKPVDTEGFITPVRAVSGNEIAILFQETENGSVKLSLRSQGKYDVAKMAQNIGGGGHKMAAGAVVEGNIETVMNSVVSKVSQWMES